MSITIGDEQKTRDVTLLPTRALLSRVKVRSIIIQKAINLLHQLERSANTLVYSELLLIYFAISTLSLALPLINAPL